MRTRHWISTAAVATVLLAGCTDSDRELIGSTDTTSTVAPVDENENAAPEAAKATTTTTIEPPRQDLTVVAGMSSSVDSIGTRYTTAGALVTNPNPGVAAYEVTAVFNLLSATGAILDTDSVNVPYIPANTTVPVAPLQIGFDIPDEPTSVDVNIAGEFGRDRGWEGVEFSMQEGFDLTVSDAVVTPDDWGNQLSFTATNPSGSVSEWGSWDCIMKQAGAIVGGQSSGISDPIVPGGSVRVDSHLSVDVLADEVICRAYA